MSEPKDEKMEDSKSTEENQESRKHFTKDDDGDEEIGCLGSHNKDLGMETSEDKGRMSKSIAEEELKDDEVEVETLSRKKLEQIIESRETLITNNVAEVITLDGEDEDNVNKTIEPRNIIESENETYKGIKFFKVDLKMGRRDVVEGKSNDEVETGEIKEDEVEIIDSDKDKKEREDEKGSDQTRSPIDDDYEADPVCKEPEPNESSVKEPNATPMARGDAETKAKIAALRESLKTTTKLNDSENNRAPRLPTATTVTSVESPASARKKAPIRPGVILPDDDSDLEGDDDAIESIDAIADFISSSEPVRPKGKVAGAASNPVPACDVTDEFTADTVLSRF